MCVMTNNFVNARYAAPNDDIGLIWMTPKIFELRKMNFLIFLLNSR